MTDRDYKLAGRAFTLARISIALICAAVLASAFIEAKNSEPRPVATEQPAE